MNFIEAIKEMKTGKKVVRPTWSDLTKHYYYIQGTKIYSSQYAEIKPVVENFDATDWEVFDDDKDWNLSDEIAIAEPHHSEYFLTKDVVKCRDLILKDIVSLDEETAEIVCFGCPIRTTKDIEIIVAKRFGDL